MSFTTSKWHCSQLTYINMMTTVVACLLITSSKHLACKLSHRLFHHASSRESDIDRVMVIGCGMVGLGATYTINTKTEDAHARLCELTEGLGPDVIIEAVGSVPTYQLAVNKISFTGRIGCIGYAKQDATLPTRLFVQKELDIRGSRNAMPSDFRAVIQYLRRGICPIDRLISSITPPRRGPADNGILDAEPRKGVQNTCKVLQSGIAIWKSGVTL